MGKIMLGMQRIMQSLRFKFWKLRDFLGDQVRGKSHRQNIFQRIYDQNLWGDPESLSGGGSGAAATSVVRRELPGLFQRFGIKSLLDAPCGDFFWMVEVVDKLDRYIGADIVPALISQNTDQYGSDKISFICADISADPLPTVDVVLCRDCFIHLPTRMIREALTNFRATGARYLLLTSDRDVELYRDIPIGSFRQVDFTLPPFSFPEPINTIYEDETGSRQLCLWAFESLPIEWVGSETKSSEVKAELVKN